MKSSNLAVNAPEGQTKKQPGLPISKEKISLKAENNNLEDVCNVYEQIVGAAFKQVNNFIDNTGQNASFVDEITTNYFKNLFLLGEIDEKSNEYDLLAGLVGKQKQLFAINEQTLLDGINYIAIPFLKQNFSYIDHYCNSINKFCHKLF